MLIFLFTKICPLISAKRNESSLFAKIKVQGNLCLIIFRPKSS